MRMNDVNDKFGSKVTGIGNKCNNLKAVIFNNTKLSFVGKSLFSFNKSGRKFIYPPNLIININFY